MKQQQKCRSVFLLTCLVPLLAIAMGGSVAAKEIFSWTDENGILHYSDMLPRGQKAQIVEVEKTYRNSTSQADATPGDTQPDTDIDSAIEDLTDGEETSEPLSLADAKREQMARHRKERREARAEDDRMCAKHRARLASVEPHRRVFYTDESGETVRMDDDKRISLVEESRDFLADNCD